MRECFKEGDQIVVKWLEHLQRMNDIRLAEMVRRNQVDGSSGRGGLRVDVRTT